MANPGTVVAHIVKLIVTMFCMTFFQDSYSFQTNNRIWTVRAYQFLLIHSIFGILRYGSSSTTKRFRNLYEWLSSLMEILPFTFYTAEIMTVFKVREEAKLLTLFVGLLPVVVESLWTIRERQKLVLFGDVVIALQALAMASLCFYKHDSYGLISLAVSYVLSRIISEDFCDRYDVPYIDISQYSFSFVEIFAMAVLKDT